MESFDPYAEWLGRPPGQPPGDHYELLGLPRFEPDIDLIAHAADMLRAKIRKIRPGAHLAEWQRLLDRLDAAKICLSDPIAKAAYDESIDMSSHTLNVSGEPVVTWDSPDRETISPTPEETHSDGAETGYAEASLNVTPEFVEAPPVVGDVNSSLQNQEHPAESPVPIIRPTRRKRNGTWRSVRFLLFTLVLLSLAIGLVLLKQQRDARLAALLPPQESSGTTGSKTPAAPIDEPLPSPEIPGTAPLPAQDAPDTNPAPPAATVTPEPEPSPMAPPVQLPEAAPPVSPAPTPQSTPEPAVDPARQQAFKRTIDSARKAMGSRDLEAAVTNLNEAVALAQTDDERAEADSVGVLQAHVDAFWGSLREQIAKMEPGSDFRVGETMAIVVEVRPDSLILRVNGQNRPFPVRTMPHLLAAALAQNLFSNSPNAKALRASFLIVEPDGDRKKARQLLQEASQGGAEVDELLAELDQSP